MSTKATSPVHPPVGTFIDGGSLKLVDVLGVGGYGVVYRAVDARQVSYPKSYAVKCLVSSGHRNHHHQNPRHRQIHIREIALHQLASAHPGVVTLHRVVEEGNLTYIIMDYAPDHDLFTQILHSCRYLGDDHLIKDIFLQLLESVEYCHSLGIYHRDLKPENILCFDDGLRIAITDFGLATTDKLSDEFRTGSVYHMSPECQGGEFAPTGNYSPMFNDIWSLGIILLNLATGRNPWKSATLSDPTFQAYLRDPLHFLPSVLPISQEINVILVRMLDVDWRKRMTLRDVRYAIEGVNKFYSDGVVFEGSMARCPWEAGMEIDNTSSASTPDEEEDLGPESTSSDIPQEIMDAHAALHSCWSKDSTELAFISQPPLVEESSSYGPQWTKRSSCGATWGALDTPAISSSDSDRDHHHFQMDLFNSTHSSDSPGSSLPTTPNCYDTSFDTRLPANSRLPNRPGTGRLMINTNILHPRIYDYDDDTAATDGVIGGYSTHSSRMHTAIEYDPYSSMFYISSPIAACSPEKDNKSTIVMPESAITAIGEDKEMTSPSVWTCSSETEMSSPSLSYYADSILLPTMVDDPLPFRRSASPSPEPFEFQSWGLFPTLHESANSKVQSLSQTCQPSPPSLSSCPITDVLFPSSRPISASPLPTPTSTSFPTFINDKPTATSPKALSRLAFKCFNRASPPSGVAQDAPTSKSRYRRGCDVATVETRTSFSRNQKIVDAVEQAGAWSAARSITTAATEGGGGATKLELARDVLEHHQTGNDNYDADADDDGESDARQFRSRRQRQRQQQQQRNGSGRVQLHSPKRWFMRRRVRAT